MSKSDPFFGEEKGLARMARLLILPFPFLALAFSLAAVSVYRDAPHPAIYLSIFSLLMMLTGGAFLVRLATNEFGDRHKTIEDSRQAQYRIEELFAMTDMLQAAEDHEDAGNILMATAGRLLPEFGGALYVFNNSRDRLDLAKSWNTRKTFLPTQTLLAGNCWALKRGKSHTNDPSSQTLCCMHHVGTAVTVEVPMLARGQVFGLLVIAAEHASDLEDVQDVGRLGRSLADSMSLALSNIALREKLRTQSLRDPLTGLYNRRYMEDALERFVSLGGRSGTATSVLMIDLDNFKILNDQNGHAKGDAVLRDVATQLLSSLRPTDIISRYGGEEFVVIMPNCGLEDAAHKSESLRARIEGLSEAHGVPVTASFGVASVPETATGAIDIIPVADAALYSAKHSGKNCVVNSDRRAGRDDVQPRLARG